MEFVYGFWPGHGYACHVRLDSRRRSLGHAPVIRRSIWSDLLYFAGPAEGHMYMPELFYPCLYTEVVRAAVRLELPLCPDHMVVGQPHCVLTAWAPTPRHRIEVAICASGNFSMVT